MCVGGKKKEKGEGVWQVGLGACVTDQRGLPVSTMKEKRKEREKIEAEQIEKEHGPA